MVSLVFTSWLHQALEECFPRRVAAQGLCRHPSVAGHSLGQASRGLQ